MMIADAKAVRPSFTRIDSIKFANSAFPECFVIGAGLASGTGEGLHANKQSAIHASTKALVNISFLLARIRLFHVF
jgi:hypothetical protein